MRLSVCLAGQTSFQALVEADGQLKTFEVAESSCLMTKSRRPTCDECNLEFDIVVERKPQWSNHPLMIQLPHSYQSGYNICIQVFCDQPAVVQAGLATVPLLARDVFAA